MGLAENDGLTPHYGHFLNRNDRENDDLPVVVDGQIGDSPTFFSRELGYLV